MIGDPRDIDEIALASLYQIEPEQTEEIFKILWAESN